MAGMAVVLRSDGSRFCTRVCFFFFVVFLFVFGKCFLLGLVVSSLMERRAETVSVFNNKRVEITGIEARNEVFGENYPRQYETWKETA